MPRFLELTEKPTVLRTIDTLSRETAPSTAPVHAIFLAVGIYEGAGVNRTGVSAFRGVNCTFEAAQRLVLRDPPQ